MFFEENLLKITAIFAEKLVKDISQGQGQLLPIFSCVSLLHQQ
jgi:hypothetical protein